MNIDRLNQNLASSAYGVRGRRTDGARAAGDAAAADQAGQSGAPATDGVEVSDEARSVLRAENAVRAAPDVREELVQQLRGQVQNGQYVTNDSAVAEKLAGGQS